MTIQQFLKNLWRALRYIKNRSFIFDLAITLKTVKIILSGGGR